MDKCLTDIPNKHGEGYIILSYSDLNYHVFIILIFGYFMVKMGC